MKKALSYLFSIPVFLLWHSAVFAQFEEKKKDFYTAEMQVISDNDNYLFQLKDGYYTNGIRFTFSALRYDKEKTGRPRNETLLKIINRFEAGQSIYNPVGYLKETNGLIDRPFAGYLYGKFQQDRFYKNGTIAALAISAGTIGKSSLAERIQKGYHRFFHLYPIEGWETQLKDEANINLHLQYIKPLLQPLTRKNIFALDATGKLNAGTVFTNVSAGLSLRFGLTEQNHQSVLYHARLHRRQPSYYRTSEFFFFFQPELGYHIYNATLQGGLFRKDKGEHTASPMPWVYQHRWGLAYAKENFSLSIAVIRRSREARTMVNNENYASAGLSLRF